MKKYLKIGTLVGGILLVVGALVAGAAFAIGDFNVQRVLQGDVHHAPAQTTSFSSKTQLLKMDVGFGKVTLTRAAGEDIEVTASPDLFRMEETDENLKLMDRRSEKSRWKWYRVFGEYQFDADITVAIPEKFQGKVEIKANCGDVTLRDISGQGITLNADMGTVRMENCSFTDAELNVKLGDIRIADSIFESLTIEDDMGTGRLDRVEATKLDYAGNMGDLNLEQLQSQEIVVQLDMGTIHGNIRGREEDYRILVNCSAGNSRVKNRFEGKYKLQAEIKMGSCDIEFRP